LAYLRGNRGVLPFDSFQLYAIGIGDLGQSAVARLQQLGALGNGTFQRVSMSMDALRVAFRTVSKTMTALRRQAAKPVEDRREHQFEFASERRERCDDYEAPLQFHFPLESFRTAERREFTYDGQNFKVEQCTVRVARRQKPFQRGAMRQVFGMLEGGRKMVAKFPRWHIFARPHELGDDEREAEMFAKSAAIAEYFASKFCECAGLEADRVRFVKARVYRFFNKMCSEVTGVAVGEEVLDGEFIKYNGNDGFVSALHGCLEGQAFLHFTYEASGHRVMVTDIQGVVQRFPDGRSPQFIFSDPQVLSPEQTFGLGDLGRPAMERCMANHTCNNYCAKWRQVIGHGGKVKSQDTAMAGVTHVEGLKDPDSLDLRRVNAPHGEIRKIVTKLDLGAVVTARPADKIEAAAATSLEQTDGGPAKGRSFQSKPPAAQPKAATKKRSVADKTRDRRERQKEEKRLAAQAAEEREQERLRNIAKREGIELAERFVDVCGASARVWAAAIQQPGDWLRAWRLLGEEQRRCLVAHASRGEDLDKLSELLKRCALRVELSALLRILALPAEVLGAVSWRLARDMRDPACARPYGLLLHMQRIGHLDEFGRSLWLAFMSDARAEIDSGSDEED